VLSDLQGFNHSPDIAARATRPPKQMKFNAAFNSPDDQVRDENETDIFGFYTKTRDSFSRPYIQHMLATRQFTHLLFQRPLLAGNLLLQLTLTL